LWWCPVASAVGLSPTATLKALIDAAQRNDLDDVLYHADFPRLALGCHGRSPEDFVAFLRSIDLTEAEVIGRSDDVQPAPMHERVIVQSDGVESRFDLDLRTTRVARESVHAAADEVPAEPHYVVVEVHPHR
jgi:hypothetical protein